MFPVDYMCQVWRIESLELAEVDPKDHGQFYGGDCYLVLYSYIRAGQHQYILYMWQVSVRPIRAPSSFTSCFWKTGTLSVLTQLFFLCLTSGAPRHKR